MPDELRHYSSLPAGLRPGMTVSSSQYSGDVKEKSDISISRNRELESACHL